MSWKLETSPQLKVGKIIVGYLLDENTDRVELSEGEEHKQAVIQPCCKACSVLPSEISQVRATPDFEPS